MFIQPINIQSDRLIVSPYCRVSTDKSDQVNSFESQIKYFSDYIERNANWTLGEVYYDEGITGTSVKKRDGFNRMINDAISGKVQFIITKEVSRFARNTVDTLTYTRQLKEYGVGVYFVNDNINTLDKDGELRLTIMASLAQDESRKTSERVKWGHSRRMEAGVVFGRDLLGYTVKNGELFINADEAEIVKLIFHKYTNEDKGTYKIAQELKAEGIRAKRAKEWSNVAILRALRNEKYVGDLCQKKTYTPNYLTQNKKYNHGQEEKVYLYNHHEAIISREMWDKTQAELLRRSPSDEQKSKHSNRYWCSGKLFCGECGGRFVSRTKKLKNGETYKAWRCYAAANHGTKTIDNFGDIVGCNSSSINDSALLVCTGSAIKYVLQNKKQIINEIVDEIKALHDSPNFISISSLQGKLDKLHEKKKGAIDLHLEGVIGRDDLKRQTELYDAEINVVFKKLTLAKNANDSQDSQEAKLNSVRNEIGKIMECGIENELLYREHLDKIVIWNNKKITVYLKHLPYGIGITYKTSGKNKGYSVQICDIWLETND